MRLAGPVDPGPPLTCPLYLNERQGASVVCYGCVSNLRYYARRDKEYDVCSCL